MNKDKIRLGIMYGFLALVAYVWIEAILLIQMAYGLIIDDNPLLDRDALIANLEVIKKYCLEHTDKILAGGNPVQDLINAGMIRQDTFQNITCQNVDKEIFWTKLHEDAVRDLGRALDID